jgi:hypothetical protein
MWVVWPRDQEVRIIWYQSLAPLIRLYPSKIFISCWFRKKFLSIRFLLFLEFTAYNFFFVISLCYCSKYISSIKNKKQKEKRKKIMTWSRGSHQREPLVPKKMISTKVKVRGKWVVVSNFHKDCVELWICDV